MAKTKQKTSGVNIEDLKKSLKTLTSEMNPEQLKRANDTLEKLEATSKQDTVKNDEIQKTNLEIKKSLGKDGDVNKSLQDLLKYYKFANEKLIKKLDEGNKSKADQDKSRSRKNLSDIKYDQPITVKEALKETVAGTKGLVSKAKGLGGGIINAFKNPKGTLESMAGGIKGALSNTYKTGKDIFSTPEGYTAEGGRFGEAHAKTDAGQREILALKKEKGISLEEARNQVRKKGEASYADLSKREREISGVKEKQKFLTSQGFDPNSKDVKQLAQLTDAKNKADIRNTPAIAAQASPLATLVSKEAALAPVQKANDVAEASAKESEKQFLAANPEGDNIKSAQEITADATKEDLEISKQLLETTKESLLELRGIKEALSGGANQPQKPEPKKEAPSEAPAANAEVTPAESGPSIGDAFDLFNKRNPAGGIPRTGGTTIVGKKPSLGGRILQGGKNLIGKGGNVIKGALGGITAGGAVAAATTIGGGLALNYGLTKGADAITEAAGADTNITPEMEAQDQANWDKASFFEKAQSGVARGIEGVGGFLGADKTVAAAKAARIKSETEYLKNKPTETAAGGKIPGGGQITDPNAPDYNSLYAQQVREREDILASAKPAETAAGQKVKSSAQEEYDKNTEAFSKKRAEVYDYGMKEAIKLLEKGTPEYSLEEEIKSTIRSKYPDFKLIDSTAGKIAMKAPLEFKNKKGGVSGKDVTAKMDDSQVGAMQPAAAEGKLSSDPQMDQDIKANQKRAAEVAPTKPSSTPGELSKSSLEYTDLDRERAQSKPSSAPVIMNNSSNNATTKIMPMKGDPRPNSRGSAFDKYIERTSSF